jgi:hypothetical protein
VLLLVPQWPLPDADFFSGAVLQLLLVCSWSSPGRPWAGGASVSQTGQETNRQEITILRKGIVQATPPAYHVPAGLCLGCFRLQLFQLHVAAVPDSEWCSGVDASEQHGKRNWCCYEDAMRVNAVEATPMSCKCINGGQPLMLAVTCSLGRTGWTDGALSEVGRAAC